MNIAPEFPQLRANVQSRALSSFGGFNGPLVESERLVCLARHLRSEAMLADAKPEAVAEALGNSLEVAFERWHEWVMLQRDFLIDGIWFPLAPMARLRRRSM